MGISAAKKTRLEKLRKAKDKADEELKVFKEEQEAKFLKETGSKAASDPTAELKDSTNAAISAVKNDYTTNKGKTVDYISQKVLDVPIGLTDTQKQALRMNMALVHMVFFQQR